MSDKYNESFKKLFFELNKIQNFPFLFYFFKVTKLDIVYQCF